MIIYGVGFPLTEDAVGLAKACASDLHVVGDGLFVMGSWEDHFPVYDIVLMKPHVIAIFLVSEERANVPVSAHT
jgi:hypothetical protein